MSTALEQHLPRYELKNRLGSGGMATVYRATDKNLKRDVAIKVMHEHLGHDGTFKERFQQEAHIIAGFHHPNIIQIYDFDAIDTVGGNKVYYMVMPMLAGDTLVDVLESCRAKGATLPHERIKDIINDLANALDYAHTRGMVHRDVKPANILFDENNRAVLTDFGIARLAENSGLTADGTIIGTPAYMSPEQATGGDTDYRSDIYSLGIILFELLTGRPPFDDESTVSVLLKHAQTPPPNVSDYLDKMNPELDAVLQKVLSKDPNERHQSARALKLALESAVNSESHDERFMPITIPNTQPTSRNSVEGTVVFNDTLANQAPVPSTSKNSTITRTINTLVIKPAKQNPIGFATLAVAIVALLLLARLLQSQPALPASPALEPTIDEISGVDSMTGIDSMTGDAVFFTGDFSEGDGTNVYWELTSTNTMTRVIEDGVYRIRDDQTQRALTSLFGRDNYQYGNVNITVDSTILESSTNSSASGIVFRYQDANNYNVFAVDGMGRYSIWRLENGDWCELRNSCNGGDATDTWEPHDAVNPIGELNTLNLNVYDDQIAGYVNGELLVMMEESAFSDGEIGIYTGTPSTGGITVEIDNYNVDMGMSPSSQSMTGDDG